MTDNIPEVTSSPEVEQSAPQPSLIEKIYSGELSYQELEPSEKIAAKTAWKDSLDDRHRFLADNGWSDKPFFAGKDKNGNELQWKTADEFEKILKRPNVARERESHLMLELRKSQTELEKLKSLTKINMERSLQSEEATIDAKIAKARDNYDMDEYDKALKEKDALQASKNQAKQYYDAPVEPNQASVISPQEALVRLREDSPEDYESFVNFRRRNLWHGSEKMMTEFASKEWDSVVYSSSMSFQDKLDYVEKRTQLAFPSKFPKTTTSYMPTTNSTANTQLKSTNANQVEAVYSKLPDRDKERIANLIASGKFSSKEAVLKQFGLISKK